MVEQGQVSSRSQAESYIKLGKVRVNGQIAGKTGLFVGENDKIEVLVPLNEQYVSRAGLKLAGAADALRLEFKSKLVLDVGSSTGGFTDYALKQGAKKVVAVDVGTEQMNPGLREDSRVELYEKTDIRDFIITEKPDLILADLSFISLRKILPGLAGLSKFDTQIVVLLKPQFEAGKEQINRGVIKNERLRRQILKDFEEWAKENFVIVAKADSQVAGTRGNHERFYSLRLKS